MPIVLLDRNVISVCNQKLKGQEISAYRKRELRKLNSPHNQISAFLSIIEGGKGRKETKKEKEETIVKEIKIISKYFNKAKIDKNHLKKLSEILLNNELERNSNSYLQFIARMHCLLYQSIAKNKRNTVKAEIFKIVSEYNIDPKHLLITCTLGVLFGNNHLRKIFKFTNNQNGKEINNRSFNSYHDFMIISRVIRVRTLLKKWERKDKIIYFTFDKPLNKFINSVIVKNSKIQITQDVSVLELEVTYNNLFTDLSKDEISKLVEEIIEIPFNLNKT